MELPAPQQDSLLAQIYSVLLAVKEDVGGLVADRKTAQENIKRMDESITVITDRKSTRLNSSH